jgi:hypothetical protein
MAIRRTSAGIAPLVGFVPRSTAAVAARLVAAVTGQNWRPWAHDGVGAALLRYVEVAIEYRWAGLVRLTSMRGISAPHLEVF